MRKKPTATVVGFFVSQARRLGAGRWAGCGVFGRSTYDSRIPLRCIRATLAAPKRAHHVSGEHAPARSRPATR